VDTFTDYGLFTQIEQGNELFLKTHGLDQNGNLYKANYFEFHTGITQLKNVDDPNYDAAKFDEILGIGAGRNHLKLLQMISDVNNGALDIDKVLDKHFCRDNYFAWLAFNILVGNYDTQTQNYYLYSPHDSLTWYFLPWDYDGSMVYRQFKDVEGNPAQLIGVANYWSNILHSRVFQQEHNLNELNQKLDELYNILGKGAVDALVARYQPLIEQYYLNNPGFSQEFTAAEFYENLDTIRAIVQHNYELYYASIEKPMPIFLGETEATTDGTSFFWSQSFDLQGDRISYTLQISKNSRFTDLVYTKSRLTATTFTVALEPGEYYWRVFITDSKGKSQRAFDVYWENATDRNIHTGIYGIRKTNVE
ncbi:MAG: spore coat protein, partial [Ruminococcaceae bacterium]|nr:spore coat protein [Oscillospiraceae bacterium]